MTHHLYFANLTFAPGVQGYSDTTQRINNQETRVMNEVVIVRTTRNPIGSIRGGLSSVRPDDLAAVVDS